MVKMIPSDQAGEKGSDFICDLEVTRRVVEGVANCSPQNDRVFQAPFSVRSDSPEEYRKVVPD